MSAATALYLVLLARRYTKSNAVVAIFVLAALYSTFWWNYLRAQTFEIYHTLFLLAFYYHLVSAFDLQRNDSNRRKSGAQFLIAAIFFGALFLGKTVYTALWPVLVVIWALSKTELVSPVTRERRDRFLRPLLFFWLPACIFLCILAAANWSKFGSPSLLVTPNGKRKAIRSRPTCFLLWGDFSSARIKAFFSISQFSSSRSPVGQTFFGNTNWMRSPPRFSGSRCCWSIRCT